MMWGYIGTCCGTGVPVPVGPLQYYSDDLICIEESHEEITIDDDSELINIEDQPECIDLTESDEVSIDGPDGAEIIIEERGDGICDD